MSTDNVIYMRPKSKQPQEGAESLHMIQVLMHALKNPVELFCVLINTEPHNPGMKPWIFVFYAAIKSANEVRFFSYDKDTNLFHLEMAAQRTAIDRCDIMDAALEEIRASYCSFGEPSIERLMTSAGKV